MQKTGENLSVMYSSRYVESSKFYKNLPAEYLTRPDSRQSAVNKTYSEKRFRQNTGKQKRRSVMNRLSFILSVSVLINQPEKLQILIRAFRFSPPTSSLFSTPFYQPDPNFLYRSVLLSRLAFFQKGLPATKVRRCVD
jgi:hypothetical protein